VRYPAAMRPLSEFIVNPVRDDLANHAVPHLLEVFEKRLAPEVSHRDPDGSIVLRPQYERGPLLGWALYLPYETNPLSANRNGRYGGGWREEARWIRSVRETAYRLTHRRIPPQESILVTLEWEVVAKRTRDEDNLVKLMKALTDGIRIAGVVPDDSRPYVHREFPVINLAPKGPRRPHAHMHFRIERRSD
jgi:hypothetical protein